MFQGMIIVFSFFFGLIAGQEYISIAASIAAYFVVFGNIDYSEE